MNLFSIFSLFILNFNSYNKCDCDKLIGLKEANLVFHGKVTAINKIDEPFIKYEISVRISKKIKGNPNHKTIVINTSCLLTSCCGVEFEVGKKYIIFTFTRNDLIYTSNCTMTRELK